jgi:hypothetical protein
MPSGAKSYFEEQLVLAEDRVKAVQAEVAKNDALRPLGLGLYSSGVLVATVVCLGVVL